MNPERNQTPPLEVAIRTGRLLLDAGRTVAVAESCTGGYLGHLLTSVSGSSGYFPGGLIAYANEVKRRELHIPAEMLKQEGAVSESVARGMAGAVRTRFQADIGIGVTGIAGPTGGTPEKPVGLVYIAVASESDVRVARHRFSGTRQAIKELTSEAALEMLNSLLEA